MQTTNDSSQQNDYSIDQDLRDTLIAISVVARRLARRLEQEANLRQQEGEKGNEQDVPRQGDLQAAEHRLGR